VQLNPQLGRALEYSTCIAEASAIQGPFKRSNRPCKAELIVVVRHYSEGQAQVPQASIIPTVDWDGRVKLRYGME
jgi:hypothetical protein